jgi:hypothetical protein
MLENFGELCGHFSQSQTKLEVVKIQNPDFFSQGVLQAQ